jgi:predicted transcriptional regulator
MAETAKTTDLLGMVAQIVAAHLSNNSVAIADVAKLIECVHSSLAAVEQGGAEPPRPDPAVPPNKSVTADYIVCLEDGTKHKMLKRHLMSAFNMTPEQYRQRWGLPKDYPMVAPNYSKVRSALAKKAGLGTKRMRRGRGGR